MTGGPLGGSTSIPEGCGSGGLHETSDGFEPSKQASPLEVVDLMGFEPTTSAMRVPRSPN